MSWIAPTRADLDRVTRALELQHARAERFRAMYERKVRPRVLHNDIAVQEEAALLLACIPRDPDVLIKARVAALNGDFAEAAQLEYLMAPRDAAEVIEHRQAAIVSGATT